MRTQKRSSLLIGGCALVLLAGPVSESLLGDHCTAYRGPAGLVPPTGRIPTDPTPEPSPTPNPGGTTPLPTLNPGGITPAPAPGGVTPGPGGIVGGPRVGGTGAGSRGGITPGAFRRKASAGAGFERWEFWWEHNKDAYLNLKASLAELVLTTSVDYYLGKSEEAQVEAALEPTDLILQGDLVPRLHAMLDDDFYLVRDAAVLALAKIGGEGALDKILSKLGDDNRFVQESSVISLGILGDRAAASTLVSILRGSLEARKAFGVREIRPELRAIAAVALGLLGDTKSLPSLVEASQTVEARKDVAVAATLALGLFEDKESLFALRSLLENPRAEELVRAQAAASLGKLGDRDAVPLLRRALRDKSVHVARSAVIALGQLADSGDDNVVASLSSTAQRGSDLQSRNWACISLGKIGGETARKALLTVLAQDRGPVRSFAALGLGILLGETRDSYAVRALRAGLEESKENSTRGAFAIALGLARDRAAERALVEIASGKGDPDLRGYAAIGLGLMKAHRASRVVQKVLQDNQKNPALARSAAVALGMMGDRSVVPSLTELLARAETDEVRGAIALALGQIGDVTAIRPLLAQVFAKPGSRARTRAYAATALGIIGEDETLPVISRITHDSNYRALVPAVRTVMSLL